MFGYQGAVLTELPPLIFEKGNRKNKKYKKAVMDSFEGIGLQQLRYNIENFDDFYRMYDGTLSHKELKLMAPQFEHMHELLSRAELPTNIRHWDIIGSIINVLVGKLIMMQDKFIPTDTGEVAENEFLENRNKELRKSLEEIINQRIRIGLAEKGINPDNLQEFSNPQEEQMFLQQLEEEKRKLVPDHMRRLSETVKFKTQGVKWAEATLEKDKELLGFDKQYKELFKQFLLSGVCAKIVKIVYDSYKPFVWDSRTVFHSKDFGKEYLQDFQYAGRIHYQTPSQVVEEYGMYLDANTQNELLRGDQNWKELLEIQNPTVSSFRQVLTKNFHENFHVPYVGYDNMLFHKRLEELTGLPMGETYMQDEHGHVKGYRDYIPSEGINTFYRWGAKYLESRFALSSEICQVTEVYYRAMEYVGWLTYQTEYGDYTTVEVKEDILSEFLKEKGIKQTYKESWNDMVQEFEPDTLVWQLRPTIAWGVKISSGNKVEPIYLGVEPMEVQVKGLNEYDVKLPVTGFVGHSLAKKISPWQELFNYSWNTCWQLMEKELGMFFLMSVDSIPSEFNENGDAEEALMKLRNMAKKIGLMTIAPNAENMGNPNSFNQYSVMNLNHTGEIKTRLELANIAKQEAYLAIGVNPQEGVQPQQYATAEGIKVSQEAMQSQIAHIYDDFNGFIKNDQIHHLAVAQFAQSMNMDRSLYYTKGDATISWLKMSDPNLPLRTLGITVTDNNKTRKELEQVRTALLQRNTMDADSFELARLITSGTLSELLSVAEEERALRMERERIQHEMALQQLTAQEELKAKAKEEEWKREEYSKSQDRENKIHTETIQAMGRAADKQGNQEDFNIIMKTAEALRSDRKSEQEYEARLRDIDIKMENLNIKKDALLSSNNLKNRQLDIKEKEIAANERIANSNKN